MIAERNVVKDDTGAVVARIVPDYETKEYSYVTRGSEAKAKRITGCSSVKVEFRGRSYTTGEVKEILDVVDGYEVPVPELPKGVRIVSE